MTDRLFRSCSHWGAFDAVVRDGRLVEVRPFERDPMPSSLLRSTVDSVYSPTRIRQPMVRAGYLAGERGGTARRGADRFVEVDWDTALDLTAHAIASTREQHGNEAIFGGSYGWSSAGRLNHARTLLHRFLNSVGGFVDQRQNYSTAAGSVMVQRMLGGTEAVAGPVTDWPSIVANCKLMVMLGGAAPKNGLVTSGGAGEHAYQHWMREAQRAGVRFVVISPNRDDAPDYLDAEFIPIRPNTDTAMLLGMAHVVLSEGLADLAFLASHTTGSEPFLNDLLGRVDGVAKTAAWASTITGVPEDTLVRLAREMAGCRTMLTAAWALQRADNGEHVYGSLIALAAMLGQIGLPGGGFGFGYGSINGQGAPRASARGPSMMSGINPVKRFIPVARIADLLLHPGETMRYDCGHIVLPDIRLVYWAGGNPFHHHQDLNRLRRAIQRPDTVIVNEIWWTATARHADIVLPATTTLERVDIASAPRDRFLFPMHQAIEPVGQARHDFDIFRALAARMGSEAAFTEGRDMMGWVRHLYAMARERAAAEAIALPDFDTFWTQGHAEYPLPREHHVIFSAFRRDPLAHRLPTPSGRIEIHSEAIASSGTPGFPGYPVWVEPREWLGSTQSSSYPLHMITTQPETRLHGQLDAATLSVASKIQGREPVLLHPDDALARGVAQGDLVVVSNDRGSCLAGAVLTRSLMPGVVRMATGAWYHTLDPLAEKPLECHGNANVLTHDFGTSALSQGPSAQSLLVDIRPHVGPIPPMRAFDPPGSPAVAVD